MFIVHQCQSTICWNPVRVASGSKVDMVYTVHVNPWGRVKENICECPGYQYRGQCKHQEIAQRRTCGWHELFSEEVQTKDQRITGVCPKCAGPTIRQVFEDDDEA